MAGVSVADVAVAGVSGSTVVSTMVVVSGAVGGVIGLDYDPVIGAGTPLDQEARRGFLPATHQAIATLAAATTNRH